MKRSRTFLITCLAGLAVGIGTRFSVRSDSKELALLAREAWNSQDIEMADILARRSLKREASREARDVLFRVAELHSDFQLKTALLVDQSEVSSAYLRDICEAGNAAFQGNFARVAEVYWREYLEKRNDAFVIERLMSLHSVRLDHEKLPVEGNALVARGGTPTLQMLKIGLISETLFHDADTLALRTRQYLTNDSTDNTSYAGYIRCLLALGEMDSADELLKQHCPTAECKTLWSLALCDQGQFQRAANALPNSDATLMVSEFHLAHGRIALHEQRHEEAVEHMLTATAARPLSRAIRSQLCATLRAEGQSQARLQEEAQNLRTIQSLHGLVTNPKSNWDEPFLQNVGRMCRQVGATAFSEWITQYLTAVGSP